MILFLFLVFLALVWVSICTSDFDSNFLILQLCFSRQFWSSINRADYMALRLGFITVCFLRSKRIVWPISFDQGNLLNMQYFYACIYIAKRMWQWRSWDQICSTDFVVFVFCFFLCRLINFLYHMIFIIICFEAWRKSFVILLELSTSSLTLLWELEFLLE